MMHIIVRNNADIANKHVRFIKWKIRNVKEKFDDLLYFEANLSKEGSSVPKYKAVLKLGIPGHDIILTNKSENLNALWKKSFESIQRNLRKHKEKNINRPALKV